MHDLHDKVMDRRFIEDLFSRAKSAYTLQDYEVTENLLRQILKEAPRLIPPRIMLGTIYGNRGSYAEAENEFKRTLELDPVNVEALNNLGCLYRLQGRLEEAEHALRKALIQAGERGDIHYNLGNVYKQKNEIDSAVSEYTLAISHNPDFVLSYNNLGTLYDMQDRPEKAVETYLEGLSRDPNHPTLRYNLGNSYMTLQRFEDAEEAFRKTIKVKAGWVDAYNNLGIALQRQNRYDESLESFKEILTIQPDNFTALNNIATTLVKQGKTEQAVGYYKQALSSNPHYEKAAVNLGQILESSDDTLQALKELESLVERNPKNFDLRMQLAFKYQKNQQYKAAENLLAQLREERKDSPRILEALGLLYYRQGMSTEAEECFFELSALHPDYHDYRIEVAKILFEKRKVNEAIYELQDLVELHPENAEAHYLLVSYLIESEQYERAKNHLEVIKSQFPDDGRFLSLLAMVYQQMGNRSQALHTADELISLQGKRANPDDITALNESLELYEKAVEAFTSEHGRAWEKSLERLGALGLGEKRKSKEVLEPQLESAQAKEIEADSVPILDFGDMSIEFSDEDLVEDPIIDLEPIIKKEERSEDVIRRVEEKLDGMAPSLMSLIDEAGGNFTSPSPSPAQAPPPSSQASPSRPEPASRKPANPEPQEPRYQPQNSIPSYQQEPRQSPQAAYPQQAQQQAAPQQQQSPNNYPQQAQQQAAPQQQQARAPVAQEQQQEAIRQQSAQVPDYPKYPEYPRFDQDPETDPPVDARHQSQEEALPDANFGPAEAEAEADDIDEPEQEPELGDNDEQGLPENENEDSIESTTLEPTPEEESMFQEIEENFADVLEAESSDPDLDLEEYFLDSFDDEPAPHESARHVAHKDQEEEAQEEEAQEEEAQERSRDSGRRMPATIDGELEPDSLFQSPEFFTDFGREDDLSAEIVPGVLEETPTVSQGQAKQPDRRAAPAPNNTSKPMRAEAKSGVPSAEAQAKLFDYLLNLTKELPVDKVREAQAQKIPERLSNIRSEILKHNPSAAKSMPFSQAKDEGALIGNTFSVMGNIGKLLPEEQKVDLRFRMKRIIDMMEKYR